MSAIEQLTLHIVQKDSICIISLVGAFDLYNVYKLRDELTLHLKIKEGKQTSNQFVLNLSKVLYVDSAGIGALITSLSDVQKYNSQLVLCNVKKDSEVGKIFAITRLDSFFDLYPNEKAAINALKKMEKN